MANESASTGVAELDRALDGLYWGDNVVWVWEGAGPSQGLFYDAIARRREDFGRTGYVAAVSDPAEVKARWPWIEILDARKGAPLTSPRSLLEAIRAFAVHARRPLLLFDSLEPLCSRWGMRTAGDFFGRCCPMLLDLGAIAYWSVPGASHYPDPAPRDRADHPVRHRRWRGPHSHQQGRGSPAGGPGPAVPLRHPGRDAAAATGSGGGARRRCVARLPPAPGAEPKRSRPPRRGLPQRHLTGGAGRKRALAGDAASPLPGASTSPSTSCSAVRSPPTTGSAGATTPPTRPRARSARCSTTPRPACAPTSSHCRDRRPSRPLPPTRAPSCVGVVSGLVQVLLGSGGRSSATVRRFSPPAAGSTPGATSATATRSACGCCGTDRMRSAQSEASSSPGTSAASGQ